MLDFLQIYLNGFTFKLMFYNLKFNVDFQEIGPLGFLTIDR